MSPEKDYRDVGLGYLVPDAESPSGVDYREVSLPDVVARGKLFIQNVDGTFTQVEIASYWIDDNLLSVAKNGEEFNQDGETTRKWS